MVFKLLRWSLHVIVIFVGKITVNGLENVPAQAPYMLVTNHVSLADAPLIFLTMPTKPENIRYFAAEKWEVHWFFGPILRRANAIFINRGQVDRRALKESVDAIAAGQIFGLAPEGTRSDTGTLMPAKGGAAYLASRANIPIVPIGLVNSDVLGANVKRLRRTEMIVNYGKPFTLPDLGRRPRGKDLTAYSHLIMAHIANLLPERYHGVYAGDPALIALQKGEDPFPYCQENPLK